MVGVSEVVGITSGRDTATISKLCIIQTPVVCQPYDSSDNKLATDGNDGTTCKYAWNDVQVMLNDATGTAVHDRQRVPGILQVVELDGRRAPPASPPCPPASNTARPATTGSRSATASGGQLLVQALRGPSMDPAKTGLADQGDDGAHLQRVDGDACPTEWNWCINGTQDCVCVYKPGTLQTANTVWDCVNPWY